jgi:MoaA/NifB/PqqE/SkfB family radical SAM enzyme
VWQQELGIQRSSVVNTLWRKLDLSALKMVHFNGGEPMLSKEHVKFLHAVPDKSQVYLNYNTNGTILPNQELQQLWSSFKLVQLDFSIDDIGHRFEYQRYPAQWNNVVKNLQWYIEFAPHNCMFAVNTTVGILNKHNLDNLDHWLTENFKQSRFGDQIEHRRQNALGKFSTLSNIVHVRQQLDSLDQRRGTSWREVFPELT